VGLVHLVTTRVLAPDAIDRALSMNARTFGVPLDGSVASAPR
jgi:hypothetical protein